MYEKMPIINAKGIFTLKLQYL